jgi:putative ABC transport system permease protein
MEAFLRIKAIFIVTIKRMYTQRGLVLANCLGLIAAVAVTMSIPIYSDAVYQNILERNILPESGEVTPTRSSFAFLYRYVGSWSGMIEWEQMVSADQYLSGQVAVDLGIQSKLFVRYLKTESMMLFSNTQGVYNNLVLPLDYLYIASISDQENHIRIIDGQMPEEASLEAGTPVEVLMREDRANTLGVQPGETFTVLAVLESGGVKTRVEFPIQVVGIWQMSEPRSSYWFYSANEFSQVLLVPESTLLQRVLPELNNQVGLAVWYWIMDPTTVQSSEVNGLLRRIDGTRRRAENLLPKVRLDLSPEDALWEYQRASQSLTIFLYSFSVPLLVMILIFTSLVMNMMVGQRRNEIAVLRSRGSSVSQLMGMAVFESVLLVMVGLAAGSPSAEAIAQVLGRARSFLDFSSESVLHAKVTISALRFGLVAGVIAIIAQMLPTLLASQNTIISFKRDRARQSRPAWWKRAWIDVLLLIPALYGIYLLRRPGGTGIASLPNDPFQNPLLLLIPAIAIFAFTLILLRVLPGFMAMVAWLAGHTRSVGLLMAARYLSRSPGGYSAPLILLTMTLSLSTFTATMAQTLDRHTHDSTYYSVGSDVRISYLGDPYGGMLGMGQQNNTQSVQSSEEGSSPRWFFLPISEHLTVPGVEAAARVVRTTARLESSVGPTMIRYMGIDRAEFPQVAFWRQDFATDSLGLLMNNMAYYPEGVLVSRDLLHSKSLRVGDPLIINAYEVGERLMLPLRIVGVIDYFPSWYPVEGPLVVGNLDYFFDQIGSELPYDVWIKGASGADYEQVIAGVEGLYRSVLRTRVAPVIITAEQLRPERQGFFGLLSIGFSTLAVMTVIGFLLYSLFSFRQRFIELGMLRAIGLSSWQMLTLLASELAFLFLTGLAVGTGLGTWISILFIPHLQVGSDLASRIPPFMVEINWLAVYQIYVLFGLLFLVAMIILGVMLMRMKIFQAIKLGEVV